MKSVRIPDDYLYEYLQVGGLSERMALLAGRSLTAPDSLERALDLSLELGMLLAATPIPDRLQDRLLQSLDGLGSRLVIRAKGLACGPSGLELGVTATRAQALEYIRDGWARAWSPSALLAGHFPFPSADIPMDAMPAIEVVEADETSMVAGAENTGRGLSRGLEPGLGQEIVLEQGVEFLPDGSVVQLDTISLKAALDSAEDSLLRNLPEAAAAMEKLAGWIRYAFGRGYNSWILPEEAFEFMDLLLPACHRLATAPQDPRDTGLAVGLPSGLPDAVVELWHLALRATKLQLAMPPAPELGYQPATGGILAQQLIGLPAAPGRASGRVVRTASFVGSSPQPSTGAVFVCEHVSLGLMKTNPVAVLERSGSRLGLGALLARDAGIPCISGIGELPALPDDLPVMVDGHLGLATINRRIGR